MLLLPDAATTLLQSNDTNDLVSGCDTVLEFVESLSAAEDHDEVLHATWDVVGPRLIQLMPHEDLLVQKKATMSIKALAFHKRLAASILKDAGQQLHAQMFLPALDRGQLQAAEVLLLLSLHGADYARGIWKICRNNVMRVTSSETAPDRELLTKSLQLVLGIFQTLPESEVLTMCTEDWIVQHFAYGFQRAVELQDSFRNSQRTYSRERMMRSWGDQVTYGAILLCTLAPKSKRIDVFFEGRNSIAKTIVSTLFSSIDLKQQCSLVDLLVLIAQVGRQQDVVDIWNSIGGLSKWMPYLTSTDDHLRTGAVEFVGFASRFVSMNTAASWDSINSVFVSLLEASTDCKRAVVRALCLMMVNDCGQCDIDVAQQIASLTYSVLDDVGHVDPLTHVFAVAAILANPAARGTKWWRDSIAVVVANLGEIPMVGEDAVEGLLATVMCRAVFAAEDAVVPMLAKSLEEHDGVYASTLISSTAHCMSVWKAAGAPAQYGINVTYVHYKGQQVKHPVLQWALFLVKHAPQWAADKIEAYPWVLAMLSSIARVGGACCWVLAKAVVASLSYWPPPPEEAPTPVMQGFVLEHLVCGLPIQVRDALESSKLGSVCLLFANVVPVPFGCLNPICPVAWVVESNDPGKDQKLAVCASCKAGTYCSRACQKTNWRRHKPVCDVLSKK